MYTIYIALSNSLSLILVNNYGIYAQSTCVRAYAYMFVYSVYIHISSEYCIHIYTG